MIHMISRISSPLLFYLQLGLQNKNKTKQQFSDTWDYYNSIAVLGDIQVKSNSEFPFKIIHLVGHSSQASMG